MDFDLFDTVAFWLVCGLVVTIVSVIGISFVAGVWWGN